MKKQSEWGGEIGALVVLVVSLAANAQAQDKTPVEWPRIIVRDGVTNTIYQPQLDAWDNFTYTATAAVARQAKGEKQPVYGQIELKARTQVDRAERTVLFDDLQITKAEFPSEPEKAETHLKALRALVPNAVRSISLDRVEANMAILEQQQKVAGLPLKNDPPDIIYSIVPAMLVMIDGNPVYRAVDKTALERVFNTRALILRDKTGKHYLHVYDGYVEAPSINGPWTVVTKVPTDVKKAEYAAVEAKAVDLLAGQENPDTRRKPTLDSVSVPELHIVTKPTELIVTAGVAAWSPIPGTQLLLATNTTAKVFKNLTDQKTYVLLCGRWFKGDEFKGPWTYVAGGDLPKDFVNIPDDSPAENAKASVPGTHQAEEAMIANSIPNTVKVDRKKAKMDPVPKYDGLIQLRIIDGTTLQYAANCPIPVIRVDASHWYAVQNGVWFLSAGATGPWVAATSVPAVIYSIPPNSPMHYVTYVRIYNYDVNYIWVGTTPGYYGAMVSPDGTVVYGTGYYYPAYVGQNVYVAYPVTYGYGCNPCWTPWAGWCVGFTVGFSCYYGYNYWCYCPCAPYWGPYYGWCYGSYYNAYGGITAWGPYGWAGTSGYIYHQNGPWTGTSRAAAGYNAWTGNQWAAQYGRAYNSVTGTSVIGRRGAVENVYTGNYATAARGAAYNSETGMFATGSKTTVGNVNTGNSATVGRGTVYNPNTGNTTTISGGKGSGGGSFLNVNGNVIVGKDGNYYRPDGSGGWDQITRPPSQVNPQGTSASALQQRRDAGTAQQWNSMQNSAATQQQRQNLNNQYRSQQMGAQRQQSFQMNRPAFRGGGRR